MPTVADCRLLAADRLEEAEILYKTGKFYGAYYIAGYCAEMALKVAICTRLNVEMFDSNDVRDDISKPFKIHKLTTLLVFAGLRKQHQEDINNGNIDLQKAWNRVSAWSEERRYERFISEEKCRQFLDAINVFYQWIQTHW
ncbi:HEPN domain-containing protein [Arsenicibacter rosenii]|uniref:Uncharacterized protein n=1 Tax=Arsenicibacter rosenii TaxID=1750698 RepID=A0A1S2VDD3_9BACT|nr:HEPN domain-containing protein [Arsenicibacter rosenii]OIN56702.1 hypothetical protein BLX24_23250 [Arsenicibacter rosenii]